MGDKSTSADLIIVGIGNPFRGDDGAGWAVIDGLQKKASGSSIKLVKQRGDIGDMLEIFEKYRRVYLVDACSSDELKGSWQRIDLHQEAIPLESSQTSTHGFGISQAVALANNLGLLPEKLVLHLISGSSYSISNTLSPPVEKSVESVIEAILSDEEIKSCMNRA